MTPPRLCTRKPCGEPGQVQAGPEFLCDDHFQDWLEEADGETDLDEHGRNKTVMRHGRAA